MAKEMTPDERRLLSGWVEQLRAEFGLEGLEAPLEELLALAGAVSAAVARPAVPVTAYVAGYLAAIRAQDIEGHGVGQAVRDVAGTGGRPPEELRADRATWPVRPAQRSRTCTCDHPPRGRRPDGCSLWRQTVIEALVALCRGYVGCTSVEHQCVLLC